MIYRLERFVQADNETRVPLRITELCFSAIPTQMHGGRHIRFDMHYFNVPTQY